MKQHTLNASAVKRKNDCLSDKIWMNHRSHGVIVNRAGSGTHGQSFDSDLEQQLQILVLWTCKQTEKITTDADCMCDSTLRGANKGTSRVEVLEAEINAAQSPCRESTWKAPVARFRNRIRVVAEERGGLVQD